MVPSASEMTATGGAGSLGEAPPPAPAIVPRSIFGFIWRVSGWHQLALLALSTAVFILIALPLELQRRIVNASVHGGDYRLVFWLALAYAGVAAAEGLIKLGLNVYRSWIGERAVLRLRNWFYALAGGSPAGRRQAEAEGVEIAVILSEAEPVGTIVGVALSEPILQIGLLVSVFGYMLFLQPWLALMSLLIFAIQILFVPLMQAAINRTARARIWTLRQVSISIVGEPAESGGEPLRQRDRIKRVFDLNMRIYRIKYAMNFLMNITNHLGVAFVLALGGWFAVQGQIEIGTVVAFVSGIAKVNEPWGDIVNWYRDMTVAQVKYRLIADAVALFEGRVPPVPDPVTATG
jgi:ABC-type bacteriocin/lantibiotic exporter with double-glycine peptidase domain